ncbi:MAG: hypothetical protein IIB54_02425, partial [Planctomycetes bacterium]|nr:hypothetical protein [Planctomycetota bacterium]
AAMFGTGDVSGLNLRLRSLDGSLTVSNSVNVADSLLNLTAIGNVTITPAITVQSLSAFSGGTLSTSSTLTATTGNIGLEGATVSLADDTTATLGRLEITGPTSTSGNLSAGNNLILHNAVTFDSAAAQSVTAGGTLFADGSLTKGVNNLALSGTNLLLGDGAGVDNITVTTGSLTMTGNTTLNLIGGNVTTGGSLAINGTTTLDLNGGNIETGGGQTYQGAVNLLSDATLTSTGSGDIHFEGIASTLDGGFDFTVVNDDGDLVFDGDIGSITQLNSFTADVNHTTNDLIDFDLIIFNNTMLIADGDILLNTVGDRPVVPAIATIVAPNGGMLFKSNSGNFTMGQNEKMTIFGTLNIEAALTATLGDLTTLNDMIVTANAINLRRRAAGPLLDTDGNLILNPEDDLGVDYVTGGKFNFNVVPTMIGAGVGNAIFGSLKGEGDVSTNKTLKTFTMRAFLEPLQPADLLFGPTILDLPPTGSTITDVSEALAAAMPREPETEAVPQETPIGSTELQRLRDLGINARRLMQDEYIHNATLGLSVFNDSRTDASQILEVTDKRLLNDRVRQVVEKYDELVGSGAEPGDDRRARIRDLLIQARTDFVTSRPDRELSPGAMRTLLRDPKYQEAREYFDLLTSLLNDVKLLGLTRREYRDVETYLLKDIESTFLDTDYLRQILFTDPGLPDDESTLPDDSK